ncbi:MAG: hypothetical protein ACREHD_13170 [Pirellulales bacterium]
MLVSGWLAEFGGLWYSRREFAIIWAMVPCASVVCLLLHWLSRMGERQPTRSGRSARTPFVRRMAFFTVVAVVAATASIYPDQWPRFDEPLPLPISAVAKCLLRIALTIVFPASLAVGAIRGRRYFRTFCIGGAAAMSVGMALMCLRATGYGGSFRVPFDWSRQLSLLVLPWEMATPVWVFAPLFGVLCVFFHWVFQLGEAAAE